MSQQFSTQANYSFAQLRRNARQCAMQALYQWEITQENIADIEQQFTDQADFAAMDQAYFMQILNGLISGNQFRHPSVNHYIKRYIDRPFSEVNPVELSILRLATFELLEKPEIPYKVILNEALELAKTFGATLGHKFVNGVLDKIAREVRQTEIKYKENKK